MIVMELTIRERHQPLNVTFAVYFTRRSGFVQFPTHPPLMRAKTRILWLWGERGFPLTQWPRWYLVQLIYRTWDVEWDEDWSAWPHCCTQAQCWMHVSGRWCRCGCRWCRFGRMIRRERDEGH